MSLIATWWAKHRTKSLGFLMVVVGAAQANFDQIRALIPPSKQGMVIMFFGILTAALGFLNSHTDSP